ncbi:hypothetical protein CHCC14820_2379 [Bacillus paralicheniformis]|uniref:Uncharacterized protein n=1 Tax=Bacillus paralicheniformis TaxID=1648923 RepID=A0A1Q8GZ91_9BACI|nr:hypothetical protein B4121_4512 [Bacillus paralicheniformis]OLF87378.1 hypothetical protein B4121_3830 [Bacillus paralicheniformis]OLF90373.1 hypothetical protein B4121_3648 [Bacillus paralicheniformis]OLF92789.1 hypothetical protein B4121_2477 [Bacillus paralicheniformis]OLF94291.1 hypothetical protein B4121_1918 [Bacillus paralicheniformis]
MVGFIQMILPEMPVNHLSMISTFRTLLQKRTVFTSVWI